MQNPKKNPKSNLGWVTVVLTYFLMVWGNLVSSTGSGLACPDWPLCHGTVLPPISAPVILEWGHRLLAFATTVMIIWTLSYLLISSHRGNRSLRRAGTTLLVLLGCQIVLGGITVLLGLSVAVSTVHLLVATLVFSGLIAVASVIKTGNPIVQRSSPKVRRLAIAGLIGMLVQVGLGGVVRHHHSGLACPNFPGCLDSFLPVPITVDTVLAFVHRWWGVLMLGLFFQLAIAAARTCPELAGPTRRAFGLAVAQVFLGIGAVLSGLETGSRALHAAVGYALWGVLFYITIRAGNLRWIWETPADIK